MADLAIVFTLIYMKFMNNQTDGIMHYIPVSTYDNLGSSPQNPENTKHRKQKIMELSTFMFFCQIINLYHSKLKNLARCGVENFGPNQNRIFQTQIAQ